ncbi:MAG: 4a-hydroxytetrahydrobiopterin dehydratase [Thermoleophilia bacterium]
MESVRLTEQELAVVLGDLPEWVRVDETLTRTWRFADFVHAIDFVEEVAQVAEELQHHPDIDIRYNKVTLLLSTHSAGGLTAQDVELATRLAGLA